MAATHALASAGQPTLADGIPASIMPAVGQRVAGMLARYLVRGGAVTWRCFPQASTDPLQACAAVLSAWLHRHIGETGCLSPVFSMQPVETCKVDEIEESQPVQRPSDVDRVRGIHITWGEGSVHRWTVGPRMDRLEAAVPGLGATVLRVLEDKSWAVYPLFTPSIVLDEASHLYWLGEPDETEYLDEHCDGDPEARDAMQAEMVTRAEIEAAFPAWALRRTAGLSQRRLHILSEHHDDTFVRRAAALALALARTPVSGDFTARREGLFTGFGAVLCWADDDVAVRVSDDYADYAWQADSFDEIGEVVLPADQPPALRQWMRMITPHLRAIGLIDRLLAHLSE